MKIIIAHTMTAEAAAKPKAKKLKDYSHLSDKRLARLSKSINPLRKKSALAEIKRRKAGGKAKAAKLKAATAEVKKLSKKSTRKSSKKLSKTTKSKSKASALVAKRSRLKDLIASLSEEQEKLDAKFDESGESKAVGRKLAAVKAKMDAAADEINSIDDKLDSMEEAED